MFKEFVTIKATLWTLTVDGQVVVMMPKSMPILVLTETCNRRKDIIFKEIIPGKGKIPKYLVGDPAYPLTSFCIKEHESCKSNAQTVFNSMLREAWNPIECAYGRLKA